MKRPIIQRLIEVGYVFCLLVVCLLILVTDSKALVLTILLITAPVFLLLIYVVRYIKVKILAPLEYLEGEIKKIEAGDLSNEITIGTDDEIGQFLATFNDMREALYKQQCVQKDFERKRKSFVNSISHDLKTPLASIAVYIEALQDGMVSTAEEEQQYYKIIENKIATLSTLSSQLSRSYETPEELSLSIHSVSCYSWTIDFFDDMNFECGIKDTTIELFTDILPDNEAAVSIDDSQFDRVLFNLMSNARRYSKNLLSINTTIEKDIFKVSIRNDGATIKTEDLNRVFERFYTEEEPNNQGHLGLGLYLAKTITKAMNGEIVVKKKEDIIEFTILLPVL